MSYIALQETPSTNSWLAANATQLENFSVVTTYSQSSGRGQRGNSWEARPGENITLSMLFRPDPDLKAAAQFVISEGVALAVVDTLADFGIHAKVKWPNDIYVDDRKICGILIENSLLGSSIQHSVIGIGLNVNQTSFESNAPNPVSMSMLSGDSYSLREVEDSLIGHLKMRLVRTADKPGRAELHDTFLNSLWRGDGGLYPFRDTASGETFRASIADIETTGFLHLSLPSAPPRRYAFKEVAFLL